MENLEGDARIGPLYCPVCATQTSDDVNYCKHCGANLRGVRQGLMTREADERFDWSKTWLANMVMSEDERRRRQAAQELSDRPEDVAAAEIRRLNELKAGVITASVGIGIAIFLAILLGSVADGIGATDPNRANILRHVWAAGIIPFMIGVALVVNAVFVTGRFSKIKQTLKDTDTNVRLGSGRTTGGLRALDAPPIPAASVTEHTTNLLVEERPEHRESPERQLARE